MAASLERGREPSYIRVNMTGLSVISVLHMTDRTDRPVIYLVYKGGYPAGPPGAYGQIEGYLAHSFDGLKTLHVKFWK